jgi:uncharacterized protein (DUF2147 family)
MKSTLRLSAILLFVFYGFNMLAGPDELLGIWYNEPKTGKIEIYKSGDKYYGKIVWLKEPLDEKGKEKTDNKNPDESKHNVKVMGLLVLWDFHYDADDKNYQDGKIYDPKEGKTYKCKMSLIDHNNLDVRGYIGFSLIGRTEHWVRTTK